MDKPRTPRALRHPVLREAADLAWQFRQTFYPRGFVKLVRLRVQALLLFKQGYSAEEIGAAMDDAARRGTRRVPKTFLFFIGWIRIRRQRQANETAARDRERAWALEKAQLEPAGPRIGGLQGIASVLDQLKGSLMPRAVPILAGVEVNRYGKPLPAVPA